MEALAAALRTPRYEIIPLPGVEDSVLEWVPRCLTVTVTASPRRGLEATLALTERLARSGYPAVPHIAARQIVDDTQLGTVLHRLDDAGVREAFVIGGDDPEPAGAFPDALTLLTAMDRLGHTLDRVGIAGYPEGHPLISTEELQRVIQAKALFASYVVTQLCFDAAAVSAWISTLRDHDVMLPVFVGIAGVVDLRRLLRVAARIGVGPSAGFLQKNRPAVVRMLLPGYRPDRLLRQLAPELANPSTGIAGVHVYTLNDLAATEGWRRHAQA